MAQGEIYQFVRNRQGHPIGVLLANHRGIGWSAVHPNDRSRKFDKNLALSIARGRSSQGSTVKPPRYISEHITAFEERARRYFKQWNR